MNRLIHKWTKQIFTKGGFMKRPWFAIKLLFPILFASSFLFSQENKTIGLKGGVSFSNFWGSNAGNLNDQVKTAVPGADPTTNFWFTVSAFTSRDLLPNILAIQSEIVYTRDGRHWKSGDNNFGFNIDYLRMPWLLKASFPVVLKPSIYAGPQIAFMFRSKLDDAPIALTAQPFFTPAAAGLRSEKFEQFTSVIDLGFAAGLELSTLLGPGSIVLDLRYNMDGIDTFNYSTAGGVKNLDFLIMLGYALNFGGSY
jgi:hypothetical protein